MSLRIDFAEGLRLGPGKVLLLEAIADHGSISAAARSIGMSYKRAWDLVDELNRMFASPLVASQSGGRQGGGAMLTPDGQLVIDHYRSIEQRAATATRSDVAELMKLRR